MHRTSGKIEGCEQVSYRKHTEDIFQCSAHLLSQVKGVHMNQKYFAPCHIM